MSHIGLIFTNDYWPVGTLVLFRKPKVILDDKMWLPISNFTIIVSSRKKSTEYDLQFFSILDFSVNNLLFNVISILNSIDLSCVFPRTNKF